MSQLALVYCGNHLSVEECVDDEMRAAALEKCRRRIQETYPQLNITQELRVACTLTIHGPLSEIERLEQDLAQHRLGAVEKNADQPIFRGAM